MIEHPGLAALILVTALIGGWLVREWLKPSTKLLGVSSVAGAPLWLLADAKTVLGPNLFYVLAAVGFSGAAAGFFVWYRDKE